MMNARWTFAVLSVAGGLMLGTLACDHEREPAGAALSESDSWRPARMPWGAPDLQGIWDSKTLTPLERPAEYADREFLTDEEAAALEREVETAPGRDQRSAPGTVDDVEGAYNNAFSSLLGRRIVGSRRTALIIDPADGKIPYTPDARSEVDAAAELAQANVAKADGPEDRVDDRCSGTMVPCMSVLCAFSRIVQTPEAVSIYYESGHLGGAYRTIPLDDRPLAPPHVRQKLGAARGRWEGDTLVVDTANFTDEQHVHPAFRTTSNMHLVERFTRVAPEEMLYRATVTDPTTFTRPWTFELTWLRIDNERNQIFESACHEGNYALTSILAGARAIETAAQGSSGS